MIHLHFELNGPPHLMRWPRVNLDFCKSGMTFIPHKAWEIQICHWVWDRILALALDLRWTGHDHAGLKFEINVLGFMFAAQIHDTRHWNTEKNRWYMPTENPFSEEGDEKPIGKPWNNEPV